MALVRITQERSKIRCIEKHKRTLAALGLRRINHSVVHEDTPQIRGMIELVRYLVRTEPFEGGAQTGEDAGARPARKRRRPTVVKKTGGAKRAAAARKKRARATGGFLSPREASRARRKRATRS
jgi:large subunit ribosomal protein L30